MKRLAALLVALVPVLASCATGTAAEPLRVEIRIHYSHYEPAAITVPAGQAVTFVLRNDDPIDHEWIVGDEALHERHRTGTETHHDARPTEISIDALTTRETTVTFDSATTLRFICHLPGHEAFGMVGVLTVTPP
ncbi:MAG: cupredoxin domain-containing protein [Candidatus Limnocylindrales bacterium]